MVLNPRAVGAAEAVAAALTADPTLAERQQRWLDVLAELLRRLTPLARQASAATELRRAVASALDLAYPDPEAVRLTKLADQIAKRTD